LSPIWRVDLPVDFPWVGVCWYAFSALPAAWSRRLTTSSLPSPASKKRATCRFWTMAWSFWTSWAVYRLYSRCPRRMTFESSTSPRSCCDDDHHWDCCCGCWYCGCECEVRHVCHHCVVDWSRRSPPPPPRDRRSGGRYWDNAWKAGAGLALSMRSEGY